MPNASDSTAVAAPSAPYRTFVSYSSVFVTTGGGTCRLWTKRHARAAGFATVAELTDALASRPPREAAFRDALNRTAARAVQRATRGRSLSPLVRNELHAEAVSVAAEFVAVRLFRFPRLAASLESRFASGSLRCGSATVRGLRRIVLRAVLRRLPVALRCIRPFPFGCMRRPTAAFVQFAEAHFDTAAADARAAGATAEALARIERLRAVALRGAPGVPCLRGVSVGEWAAVVIPLRDALRNVGRIATAATVTRMLRVVGVSSARVFAAP